MSMHSDVIKLREDNSKIIYADSHCHLLPEWFSMEEDPFPETYRKRACLVMGFYLKTPWTDEELAELVANEIEKTRRIRPYEWENGILMLRVLGEPDGTQLELEWLKKESR